MSKKQYTIIFSLILIGLLVFFFFSKKHEQAVVMEEVVTETKQIETIVPIPKIKDFFTLKAGGVILQAEYKGEQTLYDALTMAMEKGDIKFSGKIYPSLGFFVTDIGELHAGDGKNLLYYVNGKEAEVGVSEYIIKNKDVILWKLE
ncbi:MAG: DUF4430 domain-containing protein [Candidatus Pacebacteria bacterium]|nr:DUF4430 domain-containing protein [Candidatus Paceibacterota bacterium]